MCIRVRTKQYANNMQTIWNNLNKQKRELEIQIEDQLQTELDKQIEIESVKKDNNLNKQKVRLEEQLAKHLKKLSNAYEKQKNKAQSNLQKN